MICNGCARKSECGASVRCSNTGNRFFAQTYIGFDMETVRRFSSLTGYSIKIDNGKFMMMSENLVLMTGFSKNLVGKNFEIHPES